MEEKRLANAMSTAPGSATIDPARVIEIAQQIIAIPSVNGNEGPLGEYIAQTLGAAGLHIERQEVTAERFNLLATIHGRETDSPLALLFHGHMDSVPPYGMTNAFQPRMENGQIWGRGSVDQKGGLAAAIAAMEAVSRSGFQPVYGVALAAVIDEEAEHRGSMALAASRLRARAAVVTEPSNLRLVVGCKGTTPLRVTVHGRVAHGSRPWLGINAIEGAMRIAQALLEQPMPSTSLAGLGIITASLNLGIIEGGVAYNIVPSQCTLWFDRRTIPGETQESVLATASQVVTNLKAQDPALDAKVEIARPDWQWLPIVERGLRPAMTPQGAAIIERLGCCHQQIVGQAVTYGFADAYNEMDFLINDMGIPTVQYGPGDPSLCHTDAECLNVAQLITASRVYLALAMEVAGGDQ